MRNILFCILGVSFVCQAENQIKPLVLSGDLNGYLDSWIGMPYSYLLETWGQIPIGITHLPSGAAAYQFPNVTKSGEQCKVSMVVRGQDKIITGFLHNCEEKESKGKRNI